MRPWTALREPLWKRMEERDRRAVETLCERGAKVGDVFVRYINQADRDCEVYAVHGRRYAYRYFMPSDAAFVRIGDGLGRERPVSAKRLPAWAKVEEEVRS